MLCREGDRAEHLWWLASGELIVSVLGEDGSRVDVAAAEAGSLIGEPALLRGLAALNGAAKRSRCAR